jgi:ubiquinone biosynthesis protein UbiJ
MGLGWRPSAGTDPLSPAGETEALKAQLAAAQDEVAAMKARLEELEKKG